MTHSFPISADHRGFYRDSQPFFPKIQSLSTPLYPWSDTVLLPLRASLKDDLDWSAEKKCAEKIVEAGKYILWEMDFQFSMQGLYPHDTASFFAYARALEEFVLFSSAFSKDTFGICLYRGDMPFSSLFHFQAWEERFYEWMEAFIQKAGKAHELNGMTYQQEGEWIHTKMGQHYFHLFCADIFAEYLHRLISFLPESILPFIFFDIRAIPSWAFISQLFSKERFQYMHLGLEGALFPFNGITLHRGICSFGWLGDQDCLEDSCPDLPTLAICLPLDPFCDRNILAKLDMIMRSFQSKEITFRLLSEEKLTEEWDGLDRLIVIPESLSPQGKRKLQGFIAAGGEIIFQ